MGTIIQLNIEKMLLILNLKIIWADPKTSIEQKDTFGVRIWGTGQSGDCQELGVKLNGCVNPYAAHHQKRKKKSTVITTLSPIDEMKKCMKQMIDQTSRILLKTLYKIQPMELQTQIHESVCSFFITKAYVKTDF